MSKLLYLCWLSPCRKSLMAIAQECCEPYRINRRSNFPQNSNYMAFYLPSIKPFKSDEQDMQNPAEDLMANSKVIFSCGLLYMYGQALGVRLEPIYNGSVETPDVVLRTNRMRWMMFETNREGELGNSALVAWYDDDTILYNTNCILYWPLKKYFE